MLAGTHEAASRIHAELDRLQRFPSDRYVFFRTIPVGLGAQITGRVTALHVALALGRTALFARLDDPPYGQVFEPMSPVVPDLDDILTAPPVDLYSDQLERVVVLDPLICSVPRHLDVIAKRMKTRGLPEDVRLAEGAILSWMHPVDEIGTFCSAAAARLGVGEDTLGVHFRRGDKSVESMYLPAKLINKRIEAAVAQGKFTSIFLASDDPKADMSIVAPAGVELIFDTEEERFNNANHKMLASRPDRSNQETFVAFKNIHLLSICGGIIGQDNAHFATLAASSLALRGVDDDLIDLIDGHYRENNSFLISVISKFKRRIRSYGRRMFPSLTVAYRRNAISDHEQ